MNELGIFLKEKRDSLGLSLRDFGKLCDISHTHIDSIEKGFDFRTGKPVRVTNDTLVKLATALKIEPSFLFDLSIGVDPENKSKVSDALEGDKELLEFWEVLKEREDLQLLFKQTKELDKKSIQQVIRIIKAIEEEEERENQ